MTLSTVVTWNLVFKGVIVKPDVMIQSFFVSMLTGGFLSHIKNVVWIHSIEV